MTKKNPKPKYKKCQNCKLKTDSPAWAEGKLVCQKCWNYRNIHPKKLFPSKDYINKMKLIGKWKR